jgi:hypothetical protein
VRAEPPSTDPPARWWSPRRPVSRSRSPARVGQGPSAQTRPLPPASQVAFQAFPYGTLSRAQYASLPGFLGDSGGLSGSALRDCSRIREFERSESLSLRHPSLITRAKGAHRSAKRGGGLTVRSDQSFGWQASHLRSACQRRRELRLASHAKVDARTAPSLITCAKAAHDSATRAEADARSPIAPPS